MRPHLRSRIFCHSQYLSQQYDVIHANYPTVVFLEGAWTEIWCSICGANTALSSRNFFIGISGLHRHLMRIHKTENNKLVNVSAMFGRRIVSDDEASQMKAGQHAMLSVRVGSLPVRPSASTPRPAAPASAGAANGMGPANLATANFPTIATGQTATTAAPLTSSLLTGTNNNIEAAPPVKERLTEYEVWQNLQAEAKAAAKPKSKKKRASAGRSKNFFESGEDMDYDDGDDNDDDDEERFHKWTV